MISITQMTKYLHYYLMHYSYYAVTYYCIVESPLLHCPHNTHCVHALRHNQK